MNIDEAIATIKKVGIVPVIRASYVDEAKQAFESVVAGGIAIY